MAITYNNKELRAKGDQYCDNNSTKIDKQLGFGTQGIVFKTERNSAIKVYNLKEGYLRERNAYIRIEERSIRAIRGFTIPRILQWDDELLVFEMSIVHVPCILDFGGAYLDSPPEHMNRDEFWLEEKAQEFEANWKEAQVIIKELEVRAGIYLSDINTGNIKFPFATKD